MKAPDILMQQQMYEQCMRAVQLSEFPKQNMRNMIASERKYGGSFVYRKHFERDLMDNFATAIIGEKF